LENETHAAGPAILLRETFDQVAQLYDEMRPSYPDAVFADVLRWSGVDADSRLLEIGCGTGHATLAFARRGLRIDGVELGENMAARARRNLAAFPRVTVEVADFDRWTTAGRFHLAYSASAYHWLNPATREQRIGALLHPGGSLAVWRNHHVRNGSCEELLCAAEPIYMREAPALVPKRIHMPRPEEVSEAGKESLMASGLFEAPRTRMYLWRRTYTAGEYVRMLSTHSDHRMLPEPQRRRLFEGLEQLVEERFGGSVSNDYATILHIARKKS
jgi:SAM-dependent methyltransferase